jgi:hypothetical protein
MATASSRPAAPAERSKTARQTGRPFLGLIDAVIVGGPTDFTFDGAIPQGDAVAAWTWIARDLAPDLIDIQTAADDAAGVAALESLVPDLLTRARDALQAANASPDAMRRLKTQVGGDEPFGRLPVVLNALRCRALLEKAQTFGRAANNMADEASLASALQAMPLQDHAVASLLMMAAVGNVANPSRLVMSAIRLSGGASEAMIARSGFAPLIDALFAHAQAQVAPLNQVGTFGDMDLICRAIDRFHRLVRAVNGYVELARNSRWAQIASALTKTVSERVDPKLREVAPDVNLAMRRREASDRLDSDQVLSALNGMYLLATVRECRDSMAVNATFDQVWSQVGQALEIHLERNLEVLRRNPADRVTSGRLDAAIKMAELRFNAEYADVLRRAKDAAERRLNQQA